MIALDQMAEAAGLSWFDYQLETFHQEVTQPKPQRLCLYYRTGAGKSITSLAMMALWGYRDVLVVAPPSTHDSWVAQATQLGMTVETISHAKFRQKDYRVSRTRAMIADEFHLFGGHGGKGWKKIDTLARHLQAPLIVMSATPNYNDADRVYCIQHVLDPHSCKGGFLAFLYANCITEQDPFSQTPKVLGFLKYGTGEDAAAQYLAALPHVHHVPDTVQYQIVDLELPVTREPALDDYGYDRYNHRMMASIIEEKHRRVFIALVDPNGYLNLEAFDMIEEIVEDAAGPVLVFANHSTVADAVDKSYGWDSPDVVPRKTALVTGTTPKKTKAERIAAFRDGVLDVLIGTATLATGTDGLDKVCDVLIILDDTDDDSLRRQLIGRIMPRGADADASKKKVFRIRLDWS